MTIQKKAEIRAMTILLKRVIFCYECQVYIERYGTNEKE